LSAANLDTGAVSAEYVPGAGLRRAKAYSAAGRAPAAVFRKRA
jgi:hypothetical protein